jgi:hypothetical protein
MKSEYLLDQTFNASSSQCVTVSTYRGHWFYLATVDWKLMDLLVTAELIAGMGAR